MVAAISEGTWAFLGVLVTNMVVLVGLFLRVNKQAKSVEQINRAVNHQGDEAPTLIERVVRVEARTEELAVETVKHRQWQARVFTALARHVGMTLPPCDDLADYDRAFE